MRAATRWLATVAFFFAWGFAMHASGLLLHELGGHALAAWVLACGIDGYKLSIFGHGQVHYAPCMRWTETRLLLADWAGLGLTIAAGSLAAVAARKGHPAMRLLLALVAYFFLLGQLGYAASGGFHDLWDPARLSERLAGRRAHVLAWLPPLIAYSATAFFGARAVVDAFRAQLGARTRSGGLRRLATTLGAAGLLYYVAFRTEWQLRQDMAMRGVAAEAERLAVATHGPPPFPIHLVLLGIAVAGVASALARPLSSPTPEQPWPRRAILLVVGSASVCLAALLVLLARAS